MTHEEFKAVCLREFPKIESMVKTVKALNVKRVSCDVYADGHINFDICEKDRSSHTSWHCASDEDGELQIVEYDKDYNALWMPKCFYDHSIDNDAPDDGVEENLPF